jgi:2-hydroxycyclohexanecarboxyl-CoA dehydrogenase
MELGLERRVAIVTGGASNIGREIVLRFAAEGAVVYLADIDEAGGAKVAREAKGEVHVLPMDVTSQDAVEKAVAQVVKDQKKVDILVNNAGWALDRLFIEQPRSEMVRTIDTELWSFVNCTRSVLDSMIAQGYGRIVSIGSDAGRVGEWREVVHSGAKAAVIAMSKALAKEVGKYNITVNVVCPGFTPGKPETSGSHSIWAGEQGSQFPQDVLDKVAKRYPLRRLGTPSDIAPAVLLLASDLGSYITGQTLSISGGYSMM